MDFDQLLLDKNQKTNRNIKRIIAIILSDFYQLVFKQKSQDISSLNQIIYPNSKTFFNEQPGNDLPVLLERLIIFVQEKKSIELSDRTLSTLFQHLQIDKNVQYQIQRCIQQNLLEFQTKYKYKVEQDVINDLGNLIAFVIDQIITIKLQLQFSLKFSISSIICYHDMIPVFDQEILKIIFTKE